jgi:hypothetical protein
MLVFEFAGDAPGLDDANTEAIGGLLAESDEQVMVISMRFLIFNGSLPSHRLKEGGPPLLTSARRRGARHHEAIVSGAPRRNGPPGST